MSEFREPSEESIVILARAMCSLSRQMVIQTFIMLGAIVSGVLLFFAKGGAN